MSEASSSEHDRMDSKPENVYPHPPHPGSKPDPPLNDGKTTTPPKMMDDLSIFMAWQNWCWMQYSWMAYQQSLLQNIQFSSAHMPQQLHHQQPFPPHQPAPSAAAPPPAAAAPPQRETSVYKLASIQRRITAESIDFFLLAFIKVIIIFTLYGDEYIEHFNFILLIDEKTSYDDIHWMFMQTLLFRLVVIAYEGYMLSNTLPFSRGATLGKYVMDLEVVYAKEVVQENNRDHTVRIVAQPLGSVRSCFRSILKNMSISFLLPMFLPVIMFTNNRLIYDMSVGSLVVEKRRRHNR